MQIHTQHRVHLDLVGWFNVCFGLQKSVNSLDQCLPPKCHKTTREPLSLRHTWHWSHLEHWTNPKSPLEGHLFIKNSKIKQWLTTRQGIILWNVCVHLFSICMKAFNSETKPQERCIWSLLNVEKFSFWWFFSLLYDIFRRWMVAPHWVFKWHISHDVSLSIPHCVLSSVTADGAWGTAVSGQDSPCREQRSPWRADAGRDCSSAL